MAGRLAFPQMRLPVGAVQVHDVSPEPGTGRVPGDRGCSDFGLLPQHRRDSSGRPGGLHRSEAPAHLAHGPAVGSNGTARDGTPPCHACAQERDAARNGTPRPLGSPPAGRLRDALGASCGIGHAAVLGIPYTKSISTCRNRSASAMAARNASCFVGDLRGSRGCHSWGAECTRENPEPGGA